MSKQTCRNAVGRTCPSAITIVVLALAGALALIAAGGQGALAVSAIIYVDADATGNNDGSSWDDAFTTLQPALAAAVSGDEIWVTEGIYRPTSGTDRTASFQLKNGVALYGGFDPSVGDVAFEDRDWQANPTILSGDLNGDDGSHFENNGENSYHVFYHPDGTSLDSSAILDGFTVTGGNANGSDSHHDGGGMYNDDSSPTLTNCTFSGNSADHGGGMYNWGLASPTLVNCTFGDNSAGSGGGMYNYWSGPTLTSCTFAGNSATSIGGGIYNGGSWPALTNCTFSGNSASGGGGMWNAGSSPALANCTFWGNSAANGGGMGNSGPSSPRLTNCILWGDTLPEIYDWDSTPVVTYSDIQGGYDGEGNIDEDPLFVDAADGNLRLRLGSPAIDAGDNDAVPSGVTTDLDGNPRITHGRVDMGAYETLLLRVYLPLILRGY